MNLRKCSKCGIEQPLDNFYKERTARDGYRSDCKACFAKRAHDRYLQDPDRVKARVRKWQEENRDRHLASQAARRAKPEQKAKEREGHLRRKFGLSQAQYDEMLAEQNGVCAICGDPPMEGISLHVDHDHETGAVRALLCVRCNNGLALFREDPELLSAAGRYLRRHGPPDLVVVREGTTYAIELAA